MSPSRGDFSLLPNRHVNCLALAWPLCCLLLVSAGIVTHIPEEWMAFAWPWRWSGAETWSGPLLAGTSFALLICLLLAGRRVSSLSWAFPSLLVFVGIWLLLPADPPLFLRWGLGLVALALSGWLVWPVLREAPLRMIRFQVSDAMIIGIPLAVGLLVGGWQDVHPAALAASLLLYPLYALLQLTLFVLLPVRQLAAKAVSPRVIALACGLAFGLVHWPNGLLMACTGVVALVWTRQYLEGRSLLAIALVMGIGATGFRLALPEAWTYDMKVGPALVETKVRRIGPGD